MPVHVGPYFELEAVERKRERVSRQCGAHSEHPVPGAGAHFCAQCGAPVVELTSSVRERGCISVWELPDQFEDWVWVPESLYRHEVEGSYTIWLPNKRGVGLDLSEETPAVALTPDLIQGCMDRFNLVYGPLKDYLASTYPGHVSVEFGAVTYSH